MIEWIKKAKWLLLAALLYTCFFLFQRDVFHAGLGYTKGFLLEMVQILPPVLILTAMISVWIPAEIIRKRLGSASGFKGKLLSFLIGALSAGPIYAAFPATLMLFKKGASVSNLVIILSSWAVIKVPMLLVEAQFLGARFMFLRLILTLPVITGMAFLIEKIVPSGKIHSKVEEEIILPEMNCGACGFRNCEAFRQAVLRNERTLDDCVFRKKALT